MTRVGRKPQGWKLIDRLSGDADCKARLKAFLLTMTGQCTVPEVCHELGIRNRASSCCETTGCKRHSICWSRSRSGGLENQNLRNRNWPSSSNGYTSLSSN